MALPGAHRCLTGPANQLDLLVLILSLPTQNGTARRAAIRQSWAQPVAECSVGFAFVLGTIPPAPSVEVLPASRAEPTSEPDAVTLPGVAENYSTLSLKVLRALRWALDTRDFAYVLKTDDDSYVCLGGMLRWLAHQQRAPGAQRLYAGRQVGMGCVGAQHVELAAALGGERSRRCRRGWKLPHGMPFMDGAGYILSHRLVRAVVATAERSRPPPSAEDLTVSLLLRASGEEIRAGEFGVVPFAHRRSWRSVREVLPSEGVQRRLVARRCAWSDAIVLHKLSGALVGACARVKAETNAQCASFNGTVARQLATRNDAGARSLAGRGVAPAA